METVSLVEAGGETVNVAVRVTPPWEAEIVTAVDVETAWVVIVNVATVDPAGTVTLAGTLAMAELLLESATTAPPDGAAPLNVTVPWEELPPVTLVGLTPSDERATGGGGGGVPACVTVSVAVRVTPSDAEMVTEVDALTEEVATVKVALAAPAGTVTLAGTLATAELLLESATTAPPDGAAPLNVTVPWEALPPVTLVGFSARADRETVGDGAGPLLTLTLLVEDHAPGVPDELCPRTRHQTGVCGRLLLVNSDGMTVWFTMMGEETELESSICIV
jgi:hypothetical protein